MPFSFSPGQEQQNGAVGAPASPATQQVPAMNNGVPVLQVPTIPNIAVAGAAPVEEKLSPFAFRNRNKSKFGIYFQLTVFAVFGCVIIVAVGLFGYMFVLKKQIQTKAEELSFKESTFPDLPLEDMQRFSNRLKVVNKVMKEHASIRTAFQIIEHSVENPVVYTKFNISQNKTKKGYALDVTAEAPNYHVIYQQMQILKSKTYVNYLTPVAVSNIAVDKSGTINFKLNANISLEGVLPDSMTFGSSTKATSTNDISDTTQTTGNQDVSNDSTQVSTGTPQ